MRKSTILLPVIFIAAGVTLWAISEPGRLSVSAIGLGGQERAWLRDRSIDFIEDLQFKDFKKASTYHLDKTQKERDIPELIRRVFSIKHEVLDIIDYKVLDVDLDRSGTRARVRVLIHYRGLGDAAMRDSAEARRELEMLLYWFRQPDGEWVMELESSLR